MKVLTTIARSRKDSATSSSNASEHDRVPVGFEIVQQIVDLPVSEVQTTNESEKGNNPSDQNNNGKQNYSFWGTCSNCGRFCHKYSQCGKYGYGCNTPPNGQKMIYPNFK